MFSRLFNSGDNNGRRPPSYNPEYNRTATDGQQQEVPLAATVYPVAVYPDNNQLSPVVTGWAQPASIHSNNPRKDWSNGKLAAEVSYPVFAECVPISDNTEAEAATVRYSHNPVTNNPRKHESTIGQQPFHVLPAPLPSRPTHDNIPNAAHVVTYDRRSEHPSFFGRSSGRNDDSSSSSSDSSKSSRKKSNSLRNRTRAAWHQVKHHPLIHSTKSAARCVKEQTRHAVHDVKHQARHSLKHHHHHHGSRSSSPSHRHHHHHHDRDVKHQERHYCQKHHHHHDRRSLSPSHHHDIRDVVKETKKELKRSMKKLRKSLKNL